MGAGDSSGLGIVDIADKGGLIGNPLNGDEAVFRIPNVFAGLVVLVDSTVETEVAVEIMRCRSGCRRQGDACGDGVLVEVVGGVVRRAGDGGDSIAGLHAVPDGIVLVGAVEHVVDAVVSVGDLAENVVAPCREARVCGNCAAQIEGGRYVVPLTDFIHRVVIARNLRAANLVLLEVENVAGGLPVIGNGMGGAGDGSKEHGAGSIEVRERSGGALDRTETTFGSAVGVGGLVLDGGPVLELQAGVPAHGVAGPIEDAGELETGLAIEVVGDGFVVQARVADHR